MMFDRAKGNDMNMRIKNSRGLFFERTGEPQKSFWANPKLTSIVESVNGREVPRSFLDWDPCADGIKSNCPILHGILECLVGMVDPKWRARVNSIYAGRTYSNDNVAQADKNLRGGMIAISNEYTTILIAYVALYGRFCVGLDLTKEMKTSDSEVIWVGMRQHFDRTIERYKLGGVLALKGDPLMVFPDSAYQDNVDSACGLAEMWTIAHELSHHLTRDMSSRRDKEVDAIVKKVICRSSMWDELQKMPPLQRCEIEADLLATLIISGYFAPDSKRAIDVHPALLGAALSLIAIAHHRNEWSASRMDSHPGCSDRIRILLTIMCELEGARRVDSEEPELLHIVVYRYAAFLRAFGGWVEGVMRGSKPLDGPAIHVILSEIVLNAVEFGIAADEFAERM